MVLELQRRNGNDGMTTVSLRRCGDSVIYIQTLEKRRSTHFSMNSVRYRIYRVQNHPLLVVLSKIKEVCVPYHKELQEQEGYVRTKKRKCLENLRIVKQNTQDILSHLIP